MIKSQYKQFNKLKNFYRIEKNMMYFSEAAQRLYIYTHAVNEHMYMWTLDEVQRFSTRFNPYTESNISIYLLRLRNFTKDQKSVLA